MEGRGVILPAKCSSLRCSRSFQLHSRHTVQLSRRILHPFRTSWLQHLSDESSPASTFLTSSPPGDSTSTPLFYLSTEAQRPSSIHYSTERRRLACVSSRCFHLRRKHQFRSLVLMQGIYGRRNQWFVVSSLLLTRLILFAQPQPTNATFDQIRDVLGREGGKLLVQVLREMASGREVGLVVLSVSASVHQKGRDLLFRRLALPHDQRL